MGLDARKPVFGVFAQTDLLESIISRLATSEWALTRETLSLVFAQTSLLESIISRLAKSEFLANHGSSLVLPKMVPFTWAVGEYPNNVKSEIFASVLFVK